MRLKSWTNPRPTPTIRPSHGSEVRPHHLVEPVPIIIDLSDSEDDVPIPTADSSPEFDPVSAPEPVPMDITPLLGIHVFIRSIQVISTSDFLLFLHYAELSFEDEAVLPPWDYSEAELTLSQ